MAVEVNQIIKLNGGFSISIIGDSDAVANHTI